MDKYASIFRALSDKTRLRMIILLLQSGQELCVCEIVDSINGTQHNVSKHLKELKNAGLVKKKKIGKWVSYGLVSAEDDFNGFLFKAIGSISEGLYAEDLQRVKARLLLRVEGKCVIGMQASNGT